MRGNEFCQLLGFPERVGSRFRIPMRGNELDEEAAQQLDVAGFRIPMRGNEDPTGQW